MAASLDGLVDELRDAARELDAAVWASGLQGRFTSTYRSHAEQQRLYRAFISGRHNFPVAPPGSSAHEYGEAFDYLVTPSEYQSDVGETWRSWGGVWAGAADVVHFELPGASARAAARGREGEGDLLLSLAQANARLPWYVSLFTPWQLSVYNDYPSIRPIMRQLATGEPVMLENFLRQFFAR
jgi:hypothetical protein